MATSLTRRILDARTNGRLELVSRVENKLIEKIRENPNKDSYDIEHYDVAIPCIPNLIFVRDELIKDGLPPGVGVTLYSTSNRRGFTFTFPQKE
jgi:hypothetical protein